MRVLTILAAAAFLPAAALAQTISPETLKGNETACYERCVQTKDAAMCKSACACMTEEMGKYWSAKTYDERAARWTKDAKDEELNRMMSHMAWYCADRARKETQ
jgi:hypothetical protein